MKLILEEKTAVFFISPKYAIWCRCWYKANMQYNDWEINK